MPSIKSFVDERDEVLFAILITLVVIAVPTGYLTGLEAIGGTVTLYGLLLSSKAYRGKGGGAE